MKYCIRCGYGFDSQNSTITSVFHVCDKCKLIPLIESLEDGNLPEDVA